MKLGIESYMLAEDSYQFEDVELFDLDRLARYYKMLFTYLK